MLGPVYKGSRTRGSQPIFQHRMPTLRFLVLPLLLCCYSLQAAAQQTRSQEEIASDLLSADIRTIDVAISDAGRIPSKEWSTTLRRAIVGALEAEFRRDQQAKEEGYVRLYDEPLSHFLADLALHLQDPATIPTLVLVVEVHTAIQYALAAFGRLALPEALRAARDGDNPRRALKCMLALRFMVQEWGLEYFTYEERAELKSLVAAYLAPGLPVIHTIEPEFYGPLRLEYAAMLALVLDDEEVRSWVDRLASDEAAFIERLPAGEAGWISQIMAQIRGYLNGEPFLPAHRPLSEFRGRYGWTEY